jgi:hypothetical protein
LEWEAAHQAIMLRTKEHREIRDDVSPSIIRQIILGALENICLSAVAFDRVMSPDELSEYLCELLFSGIKKNLDADQKM